MLSNYFKFDNWTGNIGSLSDKDGDYELIWYADSIKWNSKFRIRKHAEEAIARLRSTSYAWHHGTVYHIILKHKKRGTLFILRPKSFLWRFINS